MMKGKVLSCLITVLTLPTLGLAQNQDKRVELDSRYTNTLTQQNMTNRTLVNVGQVAMWVYSNGRSAITPAGNAGLFFPRNSQPATATIFADGLVWGGQVKDGAVPEVRVGGGTYSMGTVPGAILSAGNPEDGTDQKNVDRVWRIRRDFGNADLTLDAAEFNSIPVTQVTEAHITQLRDIYRQDWIDWPALKGAPFYDADGNGRYEPQFNADGSPVLFPDADEPGLRDADQVVYLVSNDLDPGVVIALYGSPPPIGLEKQTTLWSYARSDALGNTIFKRIRLIYKGTATTPPNARIDSMYIAQWSDPDLGSFGDDFVGCDTTLGLGYVYNASSNDATYSAAGLPPPAAGYDLLYGPTVAGSGEAVIDFEKRQGLQNLPASSFSWFGAGSTDSDPTRGGDYNGTLQWWNIMRGFRPRPENPSVPWLDPNGNRVKFLLTGDPVAGIGWLDSNPGERRMQMISGPFSMALRDTQEVVIAVINALGSDRLSSVAVLKFMSRTIQDAVQPDPPEPPEFSLTATGLDEKVVLTWPDARDTIVERGDFKFEGYNIYQGESLNGPWRRIATFDLINEVTVIFDEVFDPETGFLLNLPVQFGSNSGLQHYIEIEDDMIAEGGLVNGQEYFFGLSTYLHRDHEPNAVESPKETAQVVPIGAVGGRDYSVVNADTTADHIAGESDGKVEVIIIDPAAITGDTYRVTFEEAEENILVWDLTNVTTGQVLFNDQTDQSGSLEGQVVDGLQLVVSGPPLQGLDWSFEGASWISAAPSDGPGSPGGLVFGAAYLGLNFLESSVEPSEYKDTHWEWYDKESFTDSNGNVVYDIGEPYQLIEGDGHQKAFLYLTWGAGNYSAFQDVAFAVFDSEADPLRQLNVLVRDRDNNGQWDLDKQYTDGDPNFVNINGGDFRFNYIFVMDSDYDPSGVTFNPTRGGVDAFDTILEGMQPILWVGYFGQRGSREPLGDTFTLDLIAPNVNTETDIFEFTTNAAGTFDITKGDLDKSGSIDISDVVLLVDVILQKTEPTGEQEFASDFNSDLAVNVADVVAIVNHILGITTSPAQIAQSEKIQVSLPEQMSVENRIISVPVNISTNAGVHGLQVELSYDASKLRPLAPDYENNNLAINHKVHDGSVSYLLHSSDGEPLSGPGPRIFQFEIIGNTRNVNPEIALDRIVIANRAGQTYDTDIGNTKASTLVIPEQFALHQNYPNPFNPETTIIFDLPEDARIDITIYNVLGQRVRRLLSNVDKIAGQHKITWDGRDDFASVLSTGVYIMQMKAGSFVSNKKMMLLR